MRTLLTCFAPTFTVVVHACLVGAGIADIADIADMLETADITDIADGEPCGQTQQFFVALCV